MRLGSLVARGSGVGADADAMGVTAPLFGTVLLGTMLLGTLLLGTLLLGVAGCGSSASASVRAVSTVTGGADAGAACSAASAKPPSGMTVLTPDQLPPQAVATLRLIGAGGPYPYAQDNTIFGNYGGTLPSERRGYYREFTVQTPGASSRGTLRVVTGSGGEDYYTADHYGSFDWIACASR